MNIEELLNAKDERPLDNIVFDGGYARVFRTRGCIGDSLSSGEYESFDENGKTGYHDYFEYSWGQYMARNAGIKVFNFSRGG
ncbi:MAG: SGNH/GDSL hydrolase family protein, partial [Clostridia bacterium]|nr:SGNH/GDSL hydrolase family protein [Clostridia bacterium]